MSEKAPNTTRVSRKRKSNILPIIFSIFFLGVAGVSAYFAWNFWHKQKDLSQRLTDLEKDHSSVKSSHETLDGELNTCKEEFSVEKESRKAEKDSLAKIEVELSTCQGNMSDLEKQRKDAEKQLKEFEEFTEKFREMIDTEQLEIRFRRGQMVVKLPAAILFPSGSIELSTRGQKALAEVASVLKTVPKRRFIVAGHTDNVPIKDAEFESNWDLSVSRAVVVLETLIKEGLKPSKLVAAGYGAYAPIASNKTATGRKRNRRIEIIVEPDLRSLQELAESDKQ